MLLSRIAFMQALYSPNLFKTTLSLCICLIWYSLHSLTCIHCVHAWYDTHCTLLPLIEIYFWCWNLEMFWRGLICWVNFVGRCKIFTNDVLNGGWLSSWLQCHHISLSSGNCFLVVNSYIFFLLINSLWFLIWNSEVEVTIKLFLLM